MEEIRVSAKTLDEAITNACIELGVTSDNLDYTIISQGTSGFFGIGAKPYIISAKSISKKPDITFEDIKKEIVGDYKDNKENVRDNKPQVVSPTAKREKPEDKSKPDNAKNDRKSSEESVNESQTKSISKKNIDNTRSGDVKQGEKKEDRKQYQRPQKKNSEARSDEKKRPDNSKHDRDTVERNPRDKDAAYRNVQGKENSYKDDRDMNPHDGDGSEKEIRDRDNRNRDFRERNPREKDGRGRRRNSFDKDSKNDNRVANRATRDDSDAGNAEAGATDNTRNDRAPRAEKEIKPLVLTEDPIKRAADFLDSLFKSMEINCEHKIEYKGEINELNINLSGEDMGVLIGKRGQTLDSLQYLVSQVVNKRQNGYILVKLDTENYRERRKETLENFALNMAKKVKKNNRPVVLEPMNAYERRIIHSVLQSEVGITTRSEGEEPYRHVVICPVKKRNSR